jgi:Rieske Fe-S protein
MDRRRFLHTTAAGGALLTLGTGAPGCGNSVMAAPLTKATVLSAATQVNALPAATLDDVPGSRGYGKVQLQVPYYVDLDRVGGAITLLLPVDAGNQERGYALPPDNTILVVQRAAGDFAAFQSSCPHAGCPLGYSANDELIECPCHSSRFLARDEGTICAGAVIRTPARAGLQSWAVSFDAALALLTIDLTQPLACNNDFPPLVTGTLTLPLADFPALSKSGGVAVGQPLGTPDPVIVIRVDGTTVAALDARCTHRACTVGYDAEQRRLVCPCHGSTFAVDGTVLTAPATVPLKHYVAMLTGDSVVITIMA